MGSVAAGLVLGLGVGVLNFKLLLAVNRKIAGEATQHGGLLAIGGFLLHTAVYIAMVLVAVYWEQISIVGVVAGLIAASLVNLYSSRKKPEHNKTKRRRSSGDRTN